MTTTEILSVVQQRGIILKPQGGQLAFKAPRGAMDSELKKALKEHKPALLKILQTDRAKSPPYSDREPGKCETCRAGAYWEGHGQGLWCFYEAMFLGKSAKAQPASVRRQDCPLRYHKRQSH